MTQLLFIFGFLVFEQDVTDTGIHGEVYKEEKEDDEDDNDKNDNKNDPGVEFVMETNITRTDPLPLAVGPCMAGVGGETPPTA